jgi:hypothetical protein
MDSLPQLHVAMRVISPSTISNAGLKTAAVSFAFQATYYDAARRRNQLP